MRAMLSRRLLPWLFALALLLGQATAFAHTLSHLGAHDDAPPDPVCEVCVAQAQLGAAVPPCVGALTISPGDNVIASLATPLRVDLVPRPACARAPPAPSSI
jgi:hypothetical protein